MLVFMTATLLLAVTGGAEQVQGQSSKMRMQQEGQQVTRGQVVEMRLDMSGGNSSRSEVIGRQGRASRGRQSRQSCTAKTGMSFTRCYVIMHHLTEATFL